MFTDWMIIALRKNSSKSDTRHSLWRPLYSHSMCCGSKLSCIKISKCKVIVACISPLKKMFYDNLVLSNKSGVRFRIKIDSKLSNLLTRKLSFSPFCTNVFQFSTLSCSVLSAQRRWIHRFYTFRSVYRCVCASVYEVLSVLKEIVPFL